MHSTFGHHLLNDAQPPAVTCSSQPNPPVSMLGMTFYGTEYPFGLCRSVVLALLSPSFLCACSLADHGKLKLLDLGYQTSTDEYLTLAFLLQSQQYSYYCYLYEDDTATVLPEIEHNQNLSPELQGQQALPTMCEISLEVNNMDYTPDYFNPYSHMYTKGNIKPLGLYLYMRNISQDMNLDMIT
ncbi:hypothetical protein TURU_014881 [Turdus rufiventris]|nr:hypothetical protein TURU_014881 [Turdus rufiventris]